MRTTPRFSSDLRVALTLPSMAESSAARMAPQESASRTRCCLTAFLTGTNDAAAAVGMTQQVIDGPTPGKTISQVPSTRLTLGDPPEG